MKQLLIIFSLLFVLTACNRGNDTDNWITYQMYEIIPEGVNPIRQELSENINHVFLGKEIVRHDPEIKFEIKYIKNVEYPNDSTALINEHYKWSKRFNALSKRWEQLIEDYDNNKISKHKFSLAASNLYDSLRVKYVIINTDNDVSSVIRYLRQYYTEEDKNDSITIHDLLNIEPDVQILSIERND